MDYKEFEDREQEQFLTEWATYKNTKMLIPNLTLNTHPLVRSSTKTGIKQGIEDFMKPHDAPTVYLVDFSGNDFDVAVEAALLEQLQKEHPSLKNLEEYSSDTSGAYSNFMYQTSLDKFREIFSEQGVRDAQAR
jgi:hypothetical protein